MHKNHNTIQQLKALIIEQFWRHLKENRRYTMEFFVRGYQVEIAYPEAIYQSLGGIEIEEVGMNRKQFNNFLINIENFLTQTTEDLRHVTLYIDSTVQGQGDGDVYAKIRIRQHHYTNRHHR
jgi:hypothetical protein